MTIVENVSGKAEFDLHRTGMNVLKALAKFAGTTTDAGIIQGVNIRVSSVGVVAYATDRYRLGEVWLSKVDDLKPGNWVYEGDSPASFTIPSEVFALVVKKFKHLRQCRVVLDGKAGTYCFKFLEERLEGFLLEGDYPPVEKFLPGELMDLDKNVMLNPLLLADFAPVARALGVNGMVFSGGGKHKTVSVCAEGFRGLVMPIRFADGDAAQWCKGFAGVSDAVAETKVEAKPKSEPKAETKKSKPKTKVKPEVETEVVPVETGTASDFIKDHVIVDVVQIPTPKAIEPAPVEAEPAPVEQVEATPEPKTTKTKTKPVKAKAPAKGATVKARMSRAKTVPNVTPKMLARLERKLTEGATAVEAVGYAVGTVEGKRAMALLEAIA